MIMIMITIMIMIDNIIAAGALAASPSPLVWVHSVIETSTGVYDALDVPCKLFLLGEVHGLDPLYETITSPTLDHTAAEFSPSPQSWVL